MLACSLDSYRALLERAGKVGYRFASFAEFPVDQPADGPSILLRHDVDYSLELALEQARANRAGNVLGTFFVQLRSPVYNLLEEKNLDCLREIASLGQHLGVHFRYPPEGASAEDLRAAVAIDLDICQQATGCNFERVVAWHNPLAHLVGAPNPFPEATFLSVYSPPFFVQGQYFSDSNLRNMPEDFLRIIGDSQVDFLQLLFHPLYWVLGGDCVEPLLQATMEQVIAEAERGFFENPKWLGRNR